MVCLAAWLRFAIVFAVLAVGVLPPDGGEGGARAEDEERPPAASGPAFDFGEPRVDAEREWTILAYMDADNDLEHLLLQDVNEMEAVLPEKGVDVIVLLDRAKEYDESDGDWTDTRAFRLCTDDDMDRLASEVLDSPGELDMADGRTLASFLAHAIQAFPARHYALVLSDHGAGWTGSIVDHDAPGAEGGHDIMSTKALAAALGDGLETAGVDKLDIVCFDMCLMGQIELAIAVEPYARIMVASEALVPGRGFPYDRILDAYGNGGSAADLAIHMARSFGEYYNEHDNDSATVSVLDLARLPAVLDAMDTLVGKLAPDAPTLWPAYSRSLFFSESYMGRTDYRKGRDATASVDLVDLVRRMQASLSGSFPAAEEAKRFEETLEACVLHTYAGDARRLSHGLAIYAPVRGDMMNPEYADTVFARRTAWQDFLRRVHEVQAREIEPPRIHSVRLVGPTGEPVQVVTALSGIHLEFTIEGNNILWTLASQVKPTAIPDTYAVMYRTFIFDPGFDERKAATAVELVDLVMPEYVDGANVLRREIGGLSYQVTDGQRAFEATIDLADPSDLRTVRVPAIYAHPEDGEFLVDVFFDTTWGKARSITAFVEQPGGRIIAKQLSPRSDAVITLLYNTVTSAGRIGVMPTGTTRWGDGLELLPVFQPPGDYAMVFEAESIAGKSTVRVFPYRELPNPAFQRLLRTGGDYRAADLVGTWSMSVRAPVEGTQEGEWIPTGATFVFEAREGEENELSYAMEKEGETDLPRGFVGVDTRAAPILAWYGRDRRGRIVRTDVYLAFRIEEEGETRFLLRDLTLGGVYRLARVGGVEGPDVEGPDVESPDIEGTWTGDDGLRVVLTKDHYQLFAGGELQDEGTYEATATRMTIHSRDGDTEVLRLTFEGGRMTLVDEDGTRFVLTRRAD